MALGEGNCEGNKKAKKKKKRKEKKNQKNPAGIIELLYLWNFQANESVCVPYC